MKILMINKFYYIKGGSETYLFGLKNILEKKGHEIIVFSMKDDKNFSSKYEQYFINNIDYSKGNIISKAKNAIKIIYNFDAANKLQKLINETHPDIAHLHLFQHQLSPSIINVLKKNNIPIVYTVHDLKPICLNYKMLNSKGICEKCINKGYYQCFLNKCVKNSFLFSLINTCEGYIHNILKSYKKIDFFITPSNFYRKKLIQGGYSGSKVIHIPNFINSDEYLPNYNFKNYFVYVGRLSEEKGIATLINAMIDVKSSKLKIVGIGPMKEKLEGVVKEKKIKNVEFLGFKKGEELKRIVSESMFLVIPSEWYENGPMSVLEAMAMGKPIIGTNIAGIPEMVINEYNGYTFGINDYKGLGIVINKLLSNPNKVKEMGTKSRQLIEEKYNQQHHYDEIIKIYNYLLEKGEKRCEKECNISGYES